MMQLPPMNMQACRGGKFDYGVEMEATDSADPAPAMPMEELKEVMEKQVHVQLVLLSIKWCTHVCDMYFFKTLQPLVMVNESSSDVACFQPSICNRIVPNFSGALFLYFCGFDSSCEIYAREILPLCACICAGFKNRETCFSKFSQSPICEKIYSIHPNGLTC